MSSVKEKTEYKYLQTVSFSNWLNWDVKSYATNNLKSKYDFVKLSLVLNEQTEKVKLKDFPDQEFGILGVNNKTGVFDAYLEKGSKINQPYKIMKTNWIAYNPYRVNVGSVGIKTENQKYEYISNAYVVFSCLEDKLDNDFFFRLFKTNTFNHLVKKSTKGSVRQNLSFDLLSNIEIPLPSIPTQKSLVAKYDKELVQVRKLEQKVDELNEKIEDYLSEELGISIEEKLKNKRFYLTNFKELDRWDFWNKKEIMKSSKFDIVSFGTTLLDKPKYGSNSRASDKITDTRYVRITDINEDGSLNDEIVSSEKFDKQYLLEDNDLLIARSGNTVGKTFLYKNHFGKCIYAGYLVRYRINPKIANSDFIFFYSKTKPFKLWINSKQRVSGQPNINGQEYLSFPIPLPDIKTQEKIVNKIISLREEISDIKRKIELQKEEARKDFETNLFDL
ncbi:MAG: restriction endonuclease subunit S [Candidatus Paceibacterota bacterium]|jgi:restriction endonuclease S subunit